MSGKNAWPVVVIVTVAVVSAGLMAVLGVPRELIMLVLGAVVTPVILALVSAQNAQTAEKVGQVQQQTNGNQTKMMEIIEAQGRLLAASTPQIPAPADTPPAGTS